MKETNLKVSLKALLIVLMCISISAAALAEVEIGFFSATQGSSTEQATSGFVHVAIKYQGQWLSAMPYHGVYLTEGFNHYYHTASIIIPNIKNLSENDFRQYLGVDFNYYSDWNDPETISCSKLVGRLLNLNPKVMSFQPLSGGKKALMGLSPDEIFSVLSAQGHAVLNKCVISLL